MEEELQEFLQSCGLDSDTIFRMKEQKIDLHTVRLMSISELENFLRLGDAHRVKEFASKILASGKRKVTETFAVKLKNKLKGLEQGKTVNESWSAASCTSTVKSKQVKVTRRIHLNWISDHKQVRRDQGGGVREIDVPKSFKKKDILNEAIKIYFPDTNSKCRGPISNYTADLLDFSNNSFDENLTVEQMYELTRLTRLRFCLNTTSANSGCNQSGHETNKKEKQKTYKKAICDSEPSSLPENKDTKNKQKKHSRIRKTIQPKNTKYSPESSSSSGVSDEETSAKTKKPSEELNGKKIKRGKASRYVLNSSTSEYSAEEDHCEKHSKITEKNTDGYPCFNSKPEYNDDNSFDMDQFLLLHSDVNCTSPNQFINVDTTPLEELYFEEPVFPINNIADTLNSVAEESSFTNLPSQINNADPTQSSTNLKKQPSNSTEKKLEFRTELRHLQEKILYDADPVLINANRAGVVGSLKNAMKRSSFSFLKRLDVVFIDVCETSEGAVDEGGPTRELFRLALHEIKESKIFSGNEEEKNIVYNVTSLQKEEYLIAGKIITMSIIHGGPRPTFMSETLFNFIAYNSTKPTMNDIVSSEAYQEVLALSNAENEIEFKAIISNSEQLLGLGIEPTVQFEKKNSIIEEILHHLVIDRPHKAIEQFIEGLNLFNLVSIIKKYPDETKSLFCNVADKQMNWQYINSLFVIERSSEGTQRRSLENKIIAFWKDYLQNCIDGDCDVKVEDILSFTTGAHREPALGFPLTPTIKFLHEDNSIFPKSNTCALILYLPVKSTDYEEFVKNMDFGILNGLPTFGLY